jgi:tRNA 2-thiouridine synthesizing protein A
LPVYHRVAANRLRGPRGTLWRTVVDTIPGVTHTPGHALWVRLVRAAPHPPARVLVLLSGRRRELTLHEGRAGGTSSAPAPEDPVSTLDQVRPAAVNALPEATADGAARSVVDPAAHRRPGEPALPRADIVVDASGLLCPLPIIKLAQAIRAVDVGRVVEVTATDAGILADAPAWARSTRHEVIGQFTRGDHHSFWIRKLHD